jgi:hypothetical protein
MNAPAIRNRRKLVAVLGANQKKSPFCQLLLDTIEQMIGFTMGDDKKFIVVVIVQRGMRSIPPVKGNTIANQPFVVAVVNSLHDIFSNLV